MHFGPPADIFGVDGIIVLVVVVLVLFGSTQIPKLARSLGSAQKEFKKGLDEGSADDAKGSESLSQAAPPAAIEPAGPAASPVETNGDGVRGLHVLIPSRRADERREGDTRDRSPTERNAVPTALASVLGACRPPRSPWPSIFVDISVHVHDAGLLVAAAIAFLSLAVTADGPLGIVRICGQRLHLILAWPWPWPWPWRRSFPALRPDIEGIIVIEFGAIGLIRVATLTRTTRCAPEDPVGPAPWIDGARHHRNRGGRRRRRARQRRVSRRRPDGDRPSATAAVGYRGTVGRPDRRRGGHVGEAGDGQAPARGRSAGQTRHQAGREIAGRRPPGWRLPRTDPAEDSRVGPTPAAERPVTATCPQIERGTRCARPHDVLDHRRPTLERARSRTTEIHPLPPVGRRGRSGRRRRFVPSFANVSAVAPTTASCWWTRAAPSWPARSTGALRAWSTGRLHTAIYSHGHIDHVFGVPVWEEESAGVRLARAGGRGPRGAARPLRPLHHDRRVQRDHQPAAVRHRLAASGPPSTATPTAPTATTSTSRSAAGGPSSTTPRGRPTTTPGPGSPSPGAVLRRSVHLGVAQRRQPPEGPALPRWSGPTPSARCSPSTTARRWARGPPPRARLSRWWAADRVRPGAHRHRRAARVTGRPDARPHERRRPARRGDPHGARLRPRSMERPYLRPVYDEPEFVVRNVWRLYGGWWDGNPATLKPAPERALALELADLAGGAGALADRALALLGTETGGDAEGGGSTSGGPRRRRHAPGRAPGRVGLVGRTG